MLTIECVLDVVQEPWLTPATADVVAAPPPPDLWRHLGQLLLTQEGADVTFDVEGEQFFHAHRIVLAARSPVIKALLSGPLMPTEEEGVIVTITIGDMRPVVFKALMHFIYTDTFPDPDDDLGAEEYRELVRDLRKAADRYGMERLEQMCALVLRHVLSVDKIVAAVLAFDARHHHSDALGDACVQFTPSAGIEG